MQIFTWNNKQKYYKKKYFKKKVFFIYISKNKKFDK